LLEKFGEVDARFSWGNVFGSVAEGIATEDSDIDLKIFYCNNRENKEGNSVEESFRTFLDKYGGKVEQKFEIETESLKFHNLKKNFERTSTGEIEIKDDNLYNIAFIVFDLVFPTIETKNKKSLMPIQEILKSITKKMGKMSVHQKKILVEKCQLLLTRCILSCESYKKYQKKTGIEISEGQYRMNRLEKLAEDLKEKFSI